ncbi:MAG: hypothetical protein A2V90_01620 [Gammaproteobacteria bacterium RBG_16_57_12]|nr:MAG: hypothetical protein A2V90_01620 [Gammaproteobacteria bacterium RBG_16_57_12]
MFNIKKSAVGISAALVLLPQVAGAMTIGYFDSSREQWGFSGGGPYLSGAKQWLVDQGHTLVSTNTADATFLSGVDAFYTGLIGSVSGSEVTAMQNFVDTQGGFLFIQQDHDSGGWFGPNNQILANWGIATTGTYSNDSGHVTVGSSTWVTDPNAVAGFVGAAHSVVTSAPSTFEVLARDDLDRTILGVFDAGGGRSSDVLIATDINFWDDGIGWTDARNRALWENIWKSAGDQTCTVNCNTVPEPGTMLMLATGILGIGLARRRKNVA